MRQGMDISDYVIVAFVGLVFIAGVIGVFRFMRGKN